MSGPGVQKLHVIAQFPMLLARERSVLWLLRPLLPSTTTYIVYPLHGSTTTYPHMYHHRLYC